MCPQLSLTKDDLLKRICLAKKSNFCHGSFLLTTDLYCIVSYNQSGVYRWCKYMGNLFCLTEARNIFLHRC